MSSSINVTLHLRSVDKQERIPLLFSDSLSPHSDWQVVCATSCLVVYLTWGGDKYSWASATILILIAVSVVLFACFFAWEYFHDEPLVSMRLFKILNVLLSYVISFVIAMA